MMRPEWRSVELQRMAAPMTVEAVSDDPEPYSDVDRDAVRELWNEANPDADGLLDAEPWEG